MVASRGRSFLVGAAVLIALAAVAPAASAGSPPSSAPQPAAPHAHLYLPDAFFIGRQAVAVPRRVVHVVGVMWPYVPGQSVTVKAFLNGRLITARTVRLRADRAGYGRFGTPIASPGRGAIVVTASHEATATLGRFELHRRFLALDPHAGFGSSGLFVSLIQERLAALHFYVPQTGVYDAGTGWALDAYHRLLRWGTSQSLDQPTITHLLDGYGAFRVHFPRHGRHAEGNLSLQLLALIDGARVQAIYPISSGKPSTPTIRGDFHVYMKVPGYLPDGMYYSNFFISGYAIHGYDPAPDYPASHGCLRLPIADATSVYGWLAIGDWVDTYY